MRKFSKSQVLVAHSLINAARRMRKGGNEHPFKQYFYYWAAFNDIYSTISFDNNLRNSYITEPATGQPRREQKGSVQIPRVRRIREYQQIDEAYKDFDNDLKRRLITHPSTEFFVNRTPYWKRHRMEYDVFQQQKINSLKSVNLFQDNYRNHPEFNKIS